MGNFYVNYTLRGATQADIAKALAGRRARVTPVHKNCVVAFDEASDAQDRNEIAMLASKLSKKLKCAILAVLNHDDDILWYQLYLNGTLADEYDSTPDCFEPSRASSPSGGDATRLCDIFGGNCEEVKDVLQKKYVFAVYRHLDLVKALDISDYAVGTAYASFDRNEVPDGLNAGDVLRVGTVRTPTGKKGRSRNATLSDDELTIAFFEAAGRGDAEEIRRLITEKGFNSETLLSTGITPLYHACATGNVSGVVTLLNLGADPNRRFSFKLSSKDSAASSLTALLYAADADIVQILISRGADPNAASSESYTPLMNSARRGDLDSVKVLLSAGANPLLTGHPFLSTEDVPPKTARQFAEAELQALKSMPNIPQVQTLQYAECVEKLERIVEALIGAEQRVTKEK